MSVELIALVVNTITLLLGFVTVIGWLINRTDAQLVAVRTELGARIDGVGQQLDGLIDGIEREIVEVKIAIARIEGPPRHLYTAR